MRPSIDQSFISLAPVQLLCGLCVLLVSSITVFSASSGRIVVREELKSAHRKVIIEDLRRITGLRQLGFERDGSLILGPLHDSGSVSARDLLSRAVQSNKVIIIKDASNRRDVAFCSVVRGRVNQQQLPVFTVLIDFADFRHVIGDARAQASFNVGWGILHEIDHVISESEDTTIPFAVGECEDNINRMRRELGLPIRATYRFSPMPSPADSIFITRYVRLGFDDTDMRNRTKRYWLVWDALLVGGSSLGNQTASLTPHPLR